MTAGAARQRRARGRCIDWGGQPIPVRYVRGAAEVTTLLADHIAALVLHVARSNREGMSYFQRELPSFLSRRFEIEVPDALAEAVSSRLVESGAATRIPSPLTGDLYQVSADRALDYYADAVGPTQGTTRTYDANWQRARTEFSIFMAYFHGKQPWVDRVVEALKARNLVADEAEQDFVAENEFAPASDRIVRIDHNSAIAQELDVGLAELADLVRKDNSEKISNPADKPRFIEQIRSGSSLLKLDRVSIKAVSGLLLPILTYLSLKFGDEIIGQLASNLLNALKNLLGISF